VAAEPIDLVHLGHERVIGVYLVETPEGLALFDCGPRTCVPALVDGLRERGFELADVHHLLVSHIHLDHAGAAGTLARLHPGLQVHVSEVGAPHLVDPARLIVSARRLYGDDLDRLWQEPEPVPAENVRLTGERVAGLDCFPAPGHASHHVCYVDGDTLYAGDATGVRILPQRSILPAAPPPDIDLEGWSRTIDRIETLRPSALALTHFGVVRDVDGHLVRLRETLARWADGVRTTSEDEWIAVTRAGLAEAEGADAAEHAQRAAPLDQSYAGLARYWRKREG
jgi:glyoxylase-like metal-dependent hydrolase (beta-lactamase superfamily II)